MDNENAWVNFEWLKDLAKKVDAKGKDERQKAEAVEVAKACRTYYDAFILVGFTEDQAMELLLELFSLNTGR